MMSPAAVYRIFQRADGEAPSVRAVVIALVAAAVLITAAGVIRVARQHEVLRLGFELSRRAEQVGRMQEARRRLELERATLAAPERIRRLATQLGMAPVSPDRIRVVPPVTQGDGSIAGQGPRDSSARGNPRGAPRAARLP
jgi:cell division protein FtsL